MNRRATDGQRAGVLEGWKLVPLVPTTGMVCAAVGVVTSQQAREAYAAMLAAAPTPPAGDIPTHSIDRLTREKAAHIIARDGFQVSGVVMTKPNGSVCIVDKSAVRWMDSMELFRVMHPDAPPAGDAGQESDRLVEQFFAGNAAFNLGYTKGLEDSQYRKDAERYRHAIAREDNAEELYAAVLSNAGNVEAINAEFDAAIEASKGK
ncbi:hypothetical protein [Cupriavidus gilardii]|uniref:hypothetical protein n=1 Tax=Cupriavidus gilardii TaxID=82541 RepID=UPI0021C1A392|nr:hypothetical protein [Cupriavidus gilardii]MCT9125365.1 hypothetical protein [Cupriavidus gilardii]